MTQVRAQGCSLHTRMRSGTEAVPKPSRNILVWHGEAGWLKAVSDLYLTFWVIVEDADLSRRVLESHTAKRDDVGHTIGDFI